MSALTGVPNPGALAYFLLRALSGAGALPPGAAAPRKAFVFLDSEPAIEDLAEALRSLAPLFPGVPAEPASLMESPLSSASALERMRGGARVVLALPEAAARPLPGPADYDVARWRLKPGDPVGRTDALARLEAMGFTRAEFAEAPGEYAARGQVVDVFLPEPAKAVRLLFGGTQLDTVRAYDPETQRTVTFLDEVTLVPVPADGQKAGGRLADWTAAQDWVVFGRDAEPEGFAPAEGARAFRLAEAVEPGAWDAGARPHPRFQGSLDLAVGEMKRHLAEGRKLFLYALNRGEEERLQEILDPKLPQGGVNYLLGRIPAGFVHEADQVAVLTASEVFARSYRVRAAFPWQQPRPPGRFGWASLKAGDYVVHRKYGVAIYRGLASAAEQGDRLFVEGHRPKLPPGEAQDCLLLEFRGGDKLYVPLYEFKNVQKYLGAEGKRPRLSSLDAAGWEEVRARVQQGVEELAAEILKREAVRRAHGGHAFQADDHLETEFAASFPFEETEDQRRAIEEVKDDLTTDHPMDRLVVGDVGYGKTEVALRAALKVVRGGKQVAVMVPTTVLADQHFRNFSRRFADYPVRVCTLSRFLTQAEQKATLRELAAGRCDIVIGTHRLLAKDIRFKDLGLLVIDEEHRFGVKHKEQLRKLRADVHTLALSATPIPRSLYQSLSGLRSVSLIRSAPQGRQPVVTTVAPFSMEAAVRAIHEELARGGQVFYIHNRIKGLEERLKALEKAMPAVKFKSAHGQMPSAALEKTMWDFLARKHDVLVASSIVESGLDIPSVNTMIVEDAQDFGLAQLYQLRGRVGRGDQRAECILFYPTETGAFQDLSEEAKKRLSALKEFSALGSGFRLALRDLEIRGAGDLLGARQHGFVNAVGLEYYCELLNAEVDRQRGRKRDPRPQTTLDLKTPAGIPEGMLPSELDRIEFYKRLLDADERETEEVEQELLDLCGPLPEPVRNLLRLIRLRQKAAGAGIASMTEGNDGSVDVRFGAQTPPAPAQAADWMKRWPGRVRFVSSAEGDGFRVQLTPRENALDWAEGFLSALVGK